MFWNFLKNFLIINKFQNLIIVFSQHSYIINYLNVLNFHKKFENFLNFIKFYSWKILVNCCKIFVRI